jgi:hypothetical protein
LSEATAFGVSLSHSSVPRDPGLSLVAEATRHIVAAAPAGGPVRRLIAGWQNGPAGASLELLCTHWTPEADVVPARILRHSEALEEALRECLADARVGVRLYLTGEEGFVRRGARVAREAGLLADEVQTEVAHVEGFRVWCAHCKAVGEGLRTAVAPCPGCGRQLHVYHHFSRRIGAYMGFQIDAEVPGELPPPSGDGPAWAAPA